MSKTSQVIRNAKRVKLSESYRARRKKLKDIVHNPNTSIDEKFDAQLKLQQIPRNACPIRVRLRCELTGRSRGNYRKFRISRSKFRDLASAGLIPGVSKASW